MKKRFLTLTLMFCFLGLFVSCKSKNNNESKKEEETKIIVTEKEVKENEIEETKPEESKPKENESEKGLVFNIDNLEENNVKLLSRKNDKISFDIYTVGVEFKLRFDGKEYSIEDAVSKGFLDEDKLFSKIEEDKNNNKCTSEMYRDGGTLEYKYKDFTIIKYNSMDGKEDMYITKEKSLNELEAIINKR